MTDLILPPGVDAPASPELSEAPSAPARVSDDQTTIHVTSDQLLAVAVDGLLPETGAPAPREARVAAVEALLRAAHRQGVQEAAAAISDDVLPQLQKLHRQPRGGRANSSDARRKRTTSKAARKANR